MVRQTFSIFLFIIAFTGFSQEYAHIDTKVKNYPEFTDIDHLSIRIKNDFKDDTERIRAAFIWLTDNLMYGRTLDELFAPKPILYYQSEYGKNYQIKKYQLGKIKKAFFAKKGVCIDYSLIMAYLCDAFTIESKIIYGLAKTDVKDTVGKRLIKNHTWNAVNIDGNWQLMDPTWASGHFDRGTGKFIKKYMDHYFFTGPEDFVKTHFPSDDGWQLLKKPIDLNSFFSAPIFFPAYFQSQVKLSPKTKGTLLFSNKNEAQLVFDKLLRKNSIYYRIQGEKKLRRMRFRKENGTYISRIKFRKNLKSGNYLTVFEENKAIANFKLKH